MKNVSLIEEEWVEELGMEDGTTHMRFVLSVDTLYDYGLNWYTLMVYSTYQRYSG